MISYSKKATSRRIEFEDIDEIVETVISTNKKLLKTKKTGLSKNSSLNDYNKADLMGRALSYNEEEEIRATHHTKLKEEALLSVTMINSINQDTCDIA